SRAFVLLRRGFRPPVGSPNIILPTEQTECPPHIRDGSLERLSRKHRCHTAHRCAPIPHSVHSPAHPPEPRDARLGLPIATQPFEHRRAVAIRRLASRARNTQHAFRNRPLIPVRKSTESQKRNPHVKRGWKQ